MVARTKWRQHCSTCGVQFAAPQTWAYCSKKCEDERRGFAALEAREEQISEWLHPLYAERLELRLRLEVAMPWERGDLLAAVATNVAKEAAVRDALASEMAAPVEPILVRPLLTRDQLAFWLPILCRELDQFELSLRKSLQRAIMLGKRLIEARDALPHGEFGRLFRDHASAVEHALPFASSWARKLMTIASNPAITEEAKRSHANDLPRIPTDIETVYVLSRLAENELREAIADGDVTCKTKRAQALEMLAAGADAEPALPVDEIARALEPVNRALRRFAAQQPSGFAELKARLNAALRAIEVEIAEREGVARTELRVTAERADMRP
jgi:hypothetical protein